MKKMLLSLAAVVCAISVSAETVAFVAEGATYSGTGETVTIPGRTQNDGGIIGTPFANDACSIEWTKVNNSTSYVTGKLVRWYKSDILTVTPLQGATISKVIVQCASGYAKALQASVGESVLDATNNTVTWTGSQTEAFTLTTAEAQVRCSYIEIEYTPGVVTAAATPVIMPATEAINADTEITITCSTEGAKIYYTIDGTEPTAESTLYAGAFKLQDSATVKAIAVADGLSNSKVASRSYVFPKEISVANIAEFCAATSKVDIYTITGAVTVTYQNGSNIYVQDATGALCIFGSDLGTFKNGDILTGISGKYDLYNGQPEMVSPVAETFANKTEGAAVEPMVLPLEELSADMCWQYIKVEHAAVAAGSNARSFNMTDATLTTPVVLYNQWNVDVVTGPDMTVTGIVTLYNGKTQVYAVSVEGEAGEEPGDSGARGEKSNPWSIAEAKALYVDGQKTTGWICGYIVGYINGASPETGSVFGATGLEKANTNLLLATNPDETDVKNCIPVALPAGKIRNELNFFDHADMYKKCVELCGSIEKYFQVAGLKSTSDWALFSGDVTGVAAVETDNAAAPVEYYNLQGVRVENPAAGIYIRRQGTDVKKVIIK